MSVLPILPQGFVVGRILTSRGDSDDADKRADTAVVVGLVDFTPTTAYRKLDAATVVTHSKITAKLDSHGDLHPQRESSDNTGSDTEDGIWLPVGAWKVTYRLNAGFGALPEHNIEVASAHTEAAPLPLFANMGDPPVPGATYVQLTVPLGGQQGQVLVMNDGSLAWGDVEGGLGGAVSSVAGRTGAVVLSSADLTDGASLATDAELAAGLSGKANTTHSHQASAISDSTATGRSLVTAADAAAARTAIGAGTSNLAIGTTSTTAAAGNRQATETATGMVELATTAEATTGTDTQRAVTPAGLKAVADTKSPASGQADVNALTAAASVTVPATHSMHTLTMTGNTTLAFSNPTAGHAFTLKLSGAFTPTFPASVTWAGGTAPAYASGKVYVFATFNAGTTWTGSAL